MAAICRGLVCGPLLVVAVCGVMSGCSSDLSQLARGRTFLQGLAAGGVVEEGDVAVLPSNAERGVKDGRRDQDVTAISTDPSGAIITGPDGNYTESEAVQTAFLDSMGTDMFGSKDGSANEMARKDSTGYLGKGPSVSGQRLMLKPGQTATEKALELMDELKDSQGREEELEARVVELDAEIEKKNQRIIQSIREMNATRQELIAVRGQLEVWAGNMNELRTKIESTEADNLATMQAIIALLQNFLQVEADMKLQDAAPLNLDDLLEGQDQP